MVRPLIDFDVIKYEVGFGSQHVDERGEMQISSFDAVIELLERKIKLICEEVGATEDPIMFLSADKFVIKSLNRRHKYNNDAPEELLPNFREAFSITRPYKGTRKGEKPFHYYNIIAYGMANYECNIANGIEADDAMCIAQFDNWQHVDPSTTIICTRDKDLRQCPGWHYSWECGKQPSIGPVYTDDLGWLEKKPDGKIIGYGKSFFFYQMLVGDVVDNIQGIKGIGPAKAYKLLTEGEDKSEQCLYQKVVEAYQEAYKDDWKANIREMANLLWMVRELYEDGTPVLYKPLKV